MLEMKEMQKLLSKYLENGINILFPVKSYSTETVELHTFMESERTRGGVSIPFLQVYSVLSSIIHFWKAIRGVSSGSRLV